MSEAVVQVENLGKLYRLGERGASYKTLRESLVNIFKPKQSRQLRIAKPHLWALDDVSFSIKKGEVLGIIGRNGAGKTTLLKILSRITEPTKGKATICGRLASLLEVGTGFHPELTGRENIFLNGAILGMKKKEIEDKYEAIVAFAELKKFMDSPVKFYSSGMYVRLAFAVAAHLEPEILIIDEILAVGDIEFQKKCIGKMENVAQEGRTVLVVSHNMSTVKSVCSKALLLEEGKLVKIGSVDEVINAYLGGYQVDASEKIIKEKDHSPQGGDSIRVRSIKSLDGVQNGFRVYWRQPVSFELTIDVLAEVDDVSFGACIRMLDGKFLIVVYNNDEGRETWHFSPGRYEIQMTFENNLKPGVYMLSVGAHNRQTKVKNYFHLDAANIEILGYTKDGNIVDPSNPALFTNVPSKFTIKNGIKSV